MELSIWQNKIFDLKFQKFLVANGMAFSRNENLIRSTQLFRKLWLGIFLPFDFPPRIKKSWMVLFGTWSIFRFCYPGPRGFLLFFIGKFCDVNRFLVFFCWHKALRAKKRELSFLLARCFDQRFSSQIFK